MQRGVLHSFQVQQVIGGSPSWWEMNNMRPHPQQTTPLLRSSTSAPSLFPQHPQPSNLLPMNPCHDNQDLPESWSQLLLGGLMEEEDRCSFSPFQAKKMENWEDQTLYPSVNTHIIDVKRERIDSGYAYGYGTEEIQAARSPWSQIIPTSSPGSCVTTSLSSNVLDFSNSKADRKHHQPDHSSEDYQCNSPATGSPFKKVRVQPSPAQTFKVRKEKLGDRIAALHQLVSPFGKTDTASVLLEAIGYIRFLQGQIEALSSPYLRGGSGNARKSAQGERSCIFPEDPGQLLNDPSFIKRKGASDQEANEEPNKDLRSRGLCLVPVSCTMHVGSDNGADYWAPAFGGGFR